ncbi:GPP34 family phosphoprotein [Auritidibacter sp. NML130574]|uniref:GPP34 family phosphoprotein n=1 Tax=Auritidibacter sp. NML130574 TaxID=2170745 RepID=UPI00143DC30B|nr:GPP34 family phosphoprotein [Auritidibacter sp. NML130574]
MKIVERFVVLSLEFQDELAGVSSLLSKARVAATMADLETDGVVSFTPAELTEPWNMDNPKIIVKEKTPSSPALNDVVEKLRDKTGDELSRIVKSKKFDPLQGVLDNFEHNGLVSTHNPGPFRPTHYELVLDTTAEEVITPLTQVLLGRREATYEDRLLLGIIESINATGLMFATANAGWEQKDFSNRVHELDGHHPVLSVLHAQTSGTSALMAKSQLGPATL